jgi:hypothetical protein
MCHKTFVVGVIQKPPRPRPDASVAAMHLGVCGTTVWIGAGLCVACVTSCCQSLRTAFTSDVRRTRGPVVATSACCNIENRCFAPYKASVVRRRVPRNFLHFMF